MQKILTVFKWLFLAVGLALIALGAGASVSPPLANQILAVNAAISPSEPPWEEFDPYTVEVTTYSEPTTTNIPDRTEGSSARAVPVPFGPEEERGLAPERLVIPVIELDAPVEPTGAKKYRIREKIYEQWIVPDKFAAGWSPKSGYPGLVNNTVLFGHHNVNGAVFADLHTLNKGDAISLYAGGREYRYTVDAVLKLKEKGVTFDEMLSNAQWISATETERLTLVTCWPPYESTYRLIVVAKPAVIAP